MNQEMEFKNIVAQYSKVVPEEMDTFDLELDESEVLKITTLGEALNLLEELQ